MFDSFRNILDKNNISLAVSTYQDNSLLIVSSYDIQVVPFSRPMGIAVNGNRMAIGSKTMVSQYHNQPDLDEAFLRPAIKEQAGMVYQSDAWFAPQSYMVTGAVDVHDVSYDVSNNVWFVNTRFSCIATLDYHFSFVPVWKPKFISQLAPQDRCHLNGLTMKDGMPYLATCFAETDEYNGWRPQMMNGGVIIHIPSDEVVVRGLSMPHSPRIHNGEVFLLNSGKGELLLLSDDMSVQVLAKFPGFVRGMSGYGNYLFVGVSEARHVVKRSKLGFEKIDVSQNEPVCGVYVFDTISGKVVDKVIFNGVKEIFDIGVIEAKRPYMLEPNNVIIDNTFVFPNETIIKEVLPDA